MGPPSPFLLDCTHKPRCLVPELIDEALYLVVGRGAGGGPLPRPPIGRLRLSSPRVGGSRSPGPARLGSSLFSDSVSEAVDGSELGPEGHGALQSRSLAPPQGPSPSQSHLPLVCHPFLKIPPRPVSPTRPRATLP